MKFSPARRARDQSGQITVFVTVVMAGLVAIAGLVADGGTVMAAHQEAVSEAFSAARAAAQDLEVGTLRSNDTVLVDPAAAEATVASFITAEGHRATVSVNGDQVTVTVSFSQPMAILSAFGIGPAHVSGTATVTAYRSVAGAQQ